MFRQKLGLLVIVSVVNLVFFAIVVVFFYVFFAFVAMNVNAVNVIYLVEPFEFYNIINRPCVNTPLQIINGKIKG